MRAAIRSLLRRPAFAAATILTLALGVGANTALFRVIYAVLIQPLPFRDPGKLVQVWETHPTLAKLQVTMPDFRDWQNQTQSFEQLAAHTLSAMNGMITLLGQGEPEFVHATMSSANLFPVMGIEPLAGRAFNQREEQSKQGVVMISENLWRRKFASDPFIAGRQIRLESESLTVVGVISQRQAFPEWADLWMPLSRIDPEMQNRRKYHPLEVVGRLRPGVSAQQAQVEMTNLAARMAQLYPDTNGTEGAFVIPLGRQITGGVRPSLLIAWAAVGLVLLMACVNLAHLFMARMLERRQEMTIREALGAKRWHLIRHVLTESLLVAAAGGIAGLGLAALISDAALTLSAQQIPRMEWSTFGAPEWLFALVISLFSGILFGLPACWEVLRSRKRLSGSERTATRSRSVLGSVLMAAEVAMAFLVLAVAALLTRNFVLLVNEDQGFRAEGVWAVPNVPLRTDWNKAAEFLSTQLQPALQNIPGVDAIGAVNAAPLSLGPTEHSRFATRFGVAGKTFGTGNFPVAQNRWITPDYFRVLNIPLLQGRLLTEADRNKPRVIINQTLAQSFFPGEDPVGKQVILGVMDAQQTPNEIVGVVGDVRELGLDQDVEPTLYGVATGPLMTLLIQSSPGADQLIRDAIRRVNPDLPVPVIQPLEQNISASLARRRFALTLLMMFGGMAALLTGAGVYGLLAYSVNARLREFGVRAAVGAGPGEVVFMILREAALLTVPGLLAGLGLCLAFGRIMKSLVYQTSPVDPLSLAGAGLLLLLLIFLSAWLPARRAAAVDVAKALRTE